MDERLGPLAEWGDDRIVGGFQVRCKGERSADRPALPVDGPTAQANDVLEPATVRGPPQDKTSDDAGAGHLKLAYSSIPPHGCTSDLERLPEDQPRQHPHQGVPRDGIVRLDLL